jgi:hypothetical protein
MIGAQLVHFNWGCKLWAVWQIDMALLFSCERIQPGAGIAAALSAVVNIRVQVQACTA